jgi:hypothetical protein
MSIGKYPIVKAGSADLPNVTDALNRGDPEEYPKQKYSRSHNNSFFRYYIGNRLPICVTYLVTSHDSKGNRNA